MSRMQYDVQIRSAGVVLAGFSFCQRERFRRGGFFRLGKVALIVFFLLLLSAVPFSFATTIQVDFFFEPGCHACEQIEQDVLPELGKRFPDSCVIQRYDIGIETNFLYLLQLEDALGYEGSERGYLIVGKAHVFGPSPDVEDLCSVISSLLTVAPNAGQASSLSIPPRHDDSGQTDPIQRQFSRFTFSAVLVAGLLDGINPCAISTLIFFMSLLAVSKVKSRALILLGVSYVLASFLTYLALGFGLFRVLHLFAGFTALRAAVEWTMTAILLVLAFLSFRDAVRFRKNGRAGDVTLQLSPGMKQRIHGVMRHGLGSRSIVLGGLLAGTAVTALESVCTGQIYVPTLVLILKNNDLAGSQAWLYLLTYNLMFILPLIIVFVAVYFGLRTETLLRWSRQNVVRSKILLAIFFVLMAIFLLLT